MWWLRPEFKLSRFGCRVRTAGPVAEDRDRDVDDRRSVGMVVESLNYLGCRVRTAGPVRDDRDPDVDDRRSVGLVW